MNIKIERKYVCFTFLYFFTLLFLLLDQLDNVPFTEHLRKIKYIYMALLIVWYCYSLRNNSAKGRIQRRSHIVMFLVVFHTLLFGFVFTKDIVVAYTYVHAREMLIYYILVYITLVYIYENKLLLLYSVSTYIALAIQLLYAFLTHPGDMINPLTYWRVFFTDLRYRTDFGFVQYGYTANYCVFALCVSLLIFDILRTNNQLKKYFKPLLAMLACNIIILCMLFSTAGRSGILSLALILAVYAVCVFLSKLSASNRKLATNIIIIGVILCVIILFLTGSFSSIWEDSNRDLNISINYPVFKKIGNVWTGMGFVENSEFQVGTSNNWISIFGERTSSLDIYYVYLYFTTGIIGCILIGIALLYMLYIMIKNVWSTFGAYGFSLIVGWLFYAYWQCNMLTYRYYSPWFYLVVLLYIIDSFYDKRSIGEKT